MSAIIIDGKTIAQKVKSQLAEEIQRLKSQGVTPGLAVVMVGEDEGSKIYVRNKRRACEELGIKSLVFELLENATEAELLAKIKELNNDATIHGILVQLPLPKHLDAKVAVENVDPAKDVDCLHPQNMGQLALGLGTLLSCTPAGIMHLLKEYNISIESQHCVVIGRSNIVGKPLSLMLLNADGTVTTCHSKTKKLADFCRQADILVSAAGEANLVTADMVKPGAVVIDVGVTRLENGKIAGDVDFENVKDVASLITPMPGGVGPMTIAMLMKNVVQAAKNSLS